MAELSPFDRLELAIDALLARRDSQPPEASAGIAPLVELAAALAGMPREEFRNGLKSDLEAGTKMKTTTVSPIREGFRTLTPYLVVREPVALLEFVKRAFGAVEVYRGAGESGGMHAEVRIGDSMLMLGGWSQGAMPTSIWLYVEDADAVYAATLRAGAKSISAPVDQPYGDREAGVIDPGGNHWYISTHKGASYVRPGMATVNLYLHPTGAGKVIDFMERGLGAEVIERHNAPDGTLVHANVRIGTSQLGMSEARGDYPNMPTVIQMYVPDVDAAYERALAAGGESIQPPADKPYGDRSCGVRDSAGNHWYIATHIRDAM